jgi:hypothetical protein
MLDRPRKPSALPERFDGAAAWDKLAPEQQREIGAIALELVQASRSRALNRSPVVGRALEAAGDGLTLLLDDAALPVLGPFTRFSPVRLPSRLGRVCRACGCTEDDACEGGCSWADTDLCSSCKPVAS